jgi:serine/threonine protein kinase
LRTELQRFDYERTLDMLRQVASALDEAHALGVVHRDIKPENIFLESIAGRDLVKVVDFGISRVTAVHSEALTELDQPQVTAKGMVVGTPAYLAPELALGKAPRPASDIYALGAVAYECVAKHPPFVGSIQKVLVAQVRADPPRLEGLPPQLESLIRAMLSKTPEERPTAQGLISAIDGMKQGEPPPPVRAARKRSWRPLVIAIAVAAVLSLGGALNQLWSTDVEATSIPHTPIVQNDPPPIPSPPPPPPKVVKPRARRGLSGHRVLEGGYSIAEAKKTTGFMESLLLRCHRTTQGGADSSRKIAVRFIRIGDSTSISVEPNDAGGKSYLECIESEAKLFVWPPYEGRRAVVEVDVVP